MLVWLLLFVVPLKSLGQQSSYFYDPSGNMVAVVGASASPVIDAEPQNQLFLTNAPESFTVLASGGGISYQWLSNGIPVQGATADTLSFANTLSAPSGTFSVVISNASGSVTSTPVAILPSISSSSNLIANPFFLQGTNGWTFTGDAGFTSNNGSNCAYVNIATGSVSQAIATVPGDMYSISFLLGANGFSSSATNIAQFGNIMGFSNSFDSGAFGYKPEGFMAQAATTSTAFTFSGNMNGGTFFIDGVSVVQQSVPPIAVGVAPINQLTGWGSDATFTVSASATPPLSYQWQFDGTNLVAGGNIFVSSNGNLTISNATFANQGIYSVTVSNAYGVASSEDAVLSVSKNIETSTNLVLTLPNALENTNLTWTTGGSVPWFGQTQFSADGFASAQSGDIYGGEESWLQGVTTNWTQPFQISFWWNVSSQPPDGLSFSIDGTNYASISGTDAGWQQVVVTNIAAGTHTFVWTYTKQSNDNPTGLPFSDSGWVGDVNLAPLNAPIILTQPQSQSALVGSNVTFMVTASGSSPLSYQWWLNQTNMLIGQTNAFLSLSNVTTAISASSYFVIVSNAFDSTFSQPATLTVYPLTNWPASALRWYELGYSADGVYPIQPGGPGGQVMNVSCLMSLAGGGWTELTAAVASSFLNLNTNTIRDYLYVENGTDLYYRTPLSNLAWSWATGQDLDGTYYFSITSGESTFQVTPSSEHQLYGVGGSSGPGNTYKCLIYYTTDENSNTAQVEICQNLPGIFTSGCENGVTVYFREYSTNEASGLDMPIVIWSNPAPVVYGTPLGANQLNASATVSGQLFYTPTNGTVLNVGTNMLSVVFIPSDTNDYADTSDEVNLTVTAPEAPIIENVSVSGTNIILSWNALSDQPYQLQSSASLSPPNWTDIGVSVIATNATMSTSAPVSTNSQQFYRIVLLL